MLGFFWKPQDEQFPNMFQDLNFEKHLKEIQRLLLIARKCINTKIYVKIHIISSLVTTNSLYNRRRLFSYMTLVWL